MMAQDNKKNAESILAGIDMVPDDAAEMEQDGSDMASQEVMAAIDAKDPAALKEALKSFVSMCMDEYGSESES